MKKSTEPDSLGSILEQFHEGDLVPAPCQRELVWTRTNKRKLIASILNDWPFGLLVFHEYEKIMYIVDGLQRITTLWEYLHPDSNKTKEMDYPKERVNWSRSKGLFKSFLDLSPEQKKAFKRYTAPVQILSDCTQNEAAQVFRNLQRGKGLKTGDLLYASSYATWHPYVEQLVKTPVCQELSSQAKSRVVAWHHAAYFLGMFLSKNPKLAFGLDPLETVLDEIDKSPKETQALILQNRTDNACRLLTLAKKLDSILLEKKTLYSKFKIHKRIVFCFNMLFEVFEQLTKNHLYPIADIIDSEVFSLFQNDEKIRKNQRHYKALIDFKTSQSVYFGRAEIAELFAEVKLQIKRLVTTQEEPRYFSLEQKKEIYEKAQKRCQQCGRSIVENLWEADHIQRRADGGKTEVANGQALCFSCHNEKTAKENAYA